MGQAILRTFGLWFTNEATCSFKLPNFPFLSDFYFLKHIMADIIDKIVNQK